MLKVLVVKKKMTKKGFNQIINWILSLMAQILCRLQSGLKMSRYVTIDIRLVANQQTNISHWAQNKPT